jgi:Tol biopolymer transport system component
MFPHDASTSVFERARIPVLLLAAAGWSSVGPASAQGTTSRVSVSSTGAQSDGGADTCRISADGNVVAFTSSSTNLVDPPNLGGGDDVYIRDLSSQVTEQVSYGHAYAGTPMSTDPFPSADGRFVLYTSINFDIVGISFDKGFDVFVKDRQTGITIVISPQNSNDYWGYGLTPDGRFALRSGFTGYVRRDLVTSQELNIPIGGFAGELSLDGELLVFSSRGAYVPNDTNGKWDVFVRSLSDNTTDRVSVATDGTQGNDDSNLDGFPTHCMTPDGRYVVFSSLATNLAPNDTNGVQDVFLRDRLLGRTERISVASDGTQADGASSHAAVSADGRFIAFDSLATNLVPGDTNLVRDVFLRDRLLGTTVRVSVSTSGQQASGDSYKPSISDDGRRIAFSSDAPDLVPGDTNGYTDVFLHEMPAEPVFASFCLGDGSNPSVRDCPCGNAGASGRGCANSVGGSAGLAASGTTEPDTVVLATDGMLPSVLNIYLQSDGPRLPGVVMGDGVRCLAGTIRRLAAKHASGGASQFPESGDLSISARSAALGDPLIPGTTRYYQTYYRDNSASFCPPPLGSGANVSSAVRIVW